MKAHERIVFALDVPTAEEAARLVNLLSPFVGYFKVGLELFIGASSQVVQSTAAGLPTYEIHGLVYLLNCVPPGKLILDLKLHDIPETVERAIRAAAKYKPAFITLHVQQRETLERAVRVAKEENVTLLGVTVLTSMDEDDMKDVYPWSGFGINHRVDHLVCHGMKCGLLGYVCSPQEVKRLRELRGSLSDELFLMVPGIRPDVPIPQERVREILKDVMEKEVFTVPGFKRSVEPISDLIENTQPMKVFDPSEHHGVRIECSDCFNDRDTQPEETTMGILEPRACWNCKRLCGRGTGLDLHQPRTDKTEDELKAWVEKNKQKKIDQLHRQLAVGVGIPVEYLEPSSELKEKYDLLLRAAMEDRESAAKLVKEYVTKVNELMKKEKPIKVDDQKRVGTPRQAILDGADLLVIGRPIRDAADPIQAAKDIAREIEDAEEEKVRQ